MQGTKEHTHCLQKVSGEVHSNIWMHMDCTFGQANSIFWKCNYYFFYFELHVSSSSMIGVRWLPNSPFETKFTQHFLSRCSIQNMWSRLIGAVLLVWPTISFLVLLTVYQFIFLASMKSKASTWIALPQSVLKSYRNRLVISLMYSNLSFPPRLVNKDRHPNKNHKEANAYSCSQT